MYTALIKQYWLLNAWLMKDKVATNEEVQLQHMRSYYEFQAKIYDITRWTFLYGRNSILKHLPFDRQETLNILEVGCGTGYNMKYLASLYPHSNLIGLDVSGDMLKQAQKNLKNCADRVSLLEEPYGPNCHVDEKQDIILFSYSLSMINPQWKELIQLTPQFLSERGVIAVVDFHNANYPFYRSFMRSNHVRMDAHLLPELENHFTQDFCQIKKGLAGVWDYLMYIGKKK